MAIFTRLPSPNNVPKSVGRASSTTITFARSQTNADGDGFVVVINGMYKDLRITHVRGTIYRFVGIDVGQVYTVRTLDGKAVQRNRGLLKFTFLVDTKGDSNLNNDQFIPNSFRMLKDAGKHPDASATDEEFCAVIEEAIRG